MARRVVRPLRREQILDVASRVLSERGWSGLTFAAVCQEADISNGVLTYHFRDKDDLLFALFLREMERLRRRSYEKFVANDAPLRERLTGLLTMDPADGVERREFRMLMHHFLSVAIDRPEVSEKFAEMFETRIAEFASRLAKDADEGSIVRDPHQGARMIVLTMAGLGIVKRVMGASTSPDEMVDLLYGYLTSAPLLATVSAAPETSHGP